MCLYVYRAVIYSAAVQNTPGLESYFIFEVLALQLKGALSQEFCCFQLHSLLKSLPGTFTRSPNAQMD